MREGLCALEVVEGAEEGVAAAVEPAVGDAESVADQGGEFEVRVAGPEADFGHFGGGEEAVICVAADQVGLFADREAVVADLGILLVWWCGYKRFGRVIRTGILFLISPGQLYGTGL